MKKTISTILGVAFLLGSVFAQVPCQTEADAKKVAESLYKKGATFAETVKNTRPAYAEWTKAQYAWLSENVKLGDWYISMAIQGYRKALRTIDPENKNRRFNANEIWQNDTLWKKANVVDGQPFYVEDFNPNYYNHIINVMRRTIDAKADCKMAITFGCQQYANVYLNGEKIFDSITDERNQGSVNILTLNLKKGTNVLEVRVKTKTAKSQCAVIFLPYADPAQRLAYMARRDFESAKASEKWAELPSRQTVSALFSAKDNSRFFNEHLVNIIETSMFSAVKYENWFNKIGCAKDEKSFLERIDLFEKAFIDRKADRTLGYGIKNVRAAMEDISKTYSEYDKSLFGELEKWEKQWNSLREGVIKGDAKALENAKQFNAFAKKALLANPLLKKYPNWVFVKRDHTTRATGLPQNWQGNTSLTTFFEKTNDRLSPKRAKVPHTYKDELWSFELQNPENKRLVFKPAKDTAISDIDISYDGERVMFSSVDDNSQWNLDEFNVKTGKVKELSPRIFPDIDNYDGCYLPDGKIITGKNSPLLHAASSCVLNAIKYLAGLPDSLPLLSDNVLESVGKLKKDVFHNRQISLSLNETLVALSVSGPANPAARMAMSMLPQLDGCEMHTSHIPPAGDDLGLRRLGIHLTCDPQFTSRNLFME